MLGGAVRREKGAAEGDVQFELLPSWHLLAAALNAVRFLAMLALYGGFTAVIASVHMIEDADGRTPPVSPAMQCVMNLTVQYFLVYLLLWAFLTTKQFVPATREALTTAVQVVTQAQKTVKFAPML